MVARLLSTIVLFTLNGYTAGAAPISSHANLVRNEKRVGIFGGAARRAWVRSKSVIEIEPARGISELIRSTLGLRSRMGICPEMKDRTFEFKDEQCGDKVYGLADLVDVFNAEQMYWSAQGATNPWNAVLTGFHSGKELPKFQQLAFYQSGIKASKALAENLHSAGLLDPAWMAKATALDLGCGLGRMSNGLASLGFQQVICVDQAQTFLDAANSSLTVLAGQSEGQPHAPVVQNVSSKIKFVQSDPSLLCVVKPNSVHFVHSLITLQHMKPMLQVAYIEQLCEVLRAGGIGWFQIPTKLYNDTDSRCDLTQNHEVMAMHYTPKEEVVRHLRSRGCRVISNGEWDTINKNKKKRIGESMYFTFDKP